MDGIELIDTKKMEYLLQDLLSSFNKVKLIPSLWICGRSSTFGIRPSQQSIFLNWKNVLKRGFVCVTPIVFYGCDSNNLEDVNEFPENKEDFLVNNHYNILVSYIDNNKHIKIERYEPNDSTIQGNLNYKLEKLFTYYFRPFKVNFKLVNPQGLQYMHKDKKLCGHHILYWVIYRLKYGLEKSINLIYNSSSTHTFGSFCMNIQNIKDVI